MTARYTHLLSPIERLPHNRVSNYTDVWTLVDIHFLMRNFFERWLNIAFFKTCYRESILIIFLQYSIIATFRGLSLYPFLCQAYRTRARSYCILSQDKYSQTQILYCPRMPYNEPRACTLYISIYLWPPSTCLWYNIYTSEEARRIAHLDECDFYF